jgi:hypothetical protein
MFTTSVTSHQRQNSKASHILFRFNNGLLQHWNSGYFYFSALQACAATEYVPWRLACFYYSLQGKGCLSPSSANYYCDSRNVATNAAVVFDFLRISCGVNYLALNKLN